MKKSLLILLMAAALSSTAYGYDLIKDPDLKFTYGGVTYSSKGIGAWLIHGPGLTIPNRLIIEKNVQALLQNRSNRELLEKTIADSLKDSGYGN